MNESQQPDILADMAKSGKQLKIETGARIKAVREKSGLTQTEFAAAIGVERGAVGNWERGGGISKANLETVADAFGISFEWLATGRGDSPDVTRLVRGPPPRAVRLSDVDQTAAGFEPVAPPDLDRLATLIARARERLGRLPEEDARNLVLALLAAARTPPDPTISAPEEDQLALRADALIRFFEQKQR